MGLRPSQSNDRVLADWLSRTPSQEDQALVREVLRVIAAQEENWQIRYYSVSDISDPSITIFEPREGLTVHVRLHTCVVGEFELVRILPITTLDSNHNHTHARDR
jgi:hypothetical protein